LTNVEKNTTFVGNKKAMKSHENIFKEGVVAYGINDNSTIFSIMNTIRNGIGFSMFSKLLQSFPFSITDWSWFLGMSERTMQRYRKERKTFDKLQSEKILHIYMLYNRGVQIFGSTENFNQWLESPNISLAGEVPKKLLDSNFGIGFINDALTRIEHGISA
jgi:putative toxin-antitoxin system antitoxin component (TIGR02293 family)